jgi:microcompartment protein CcmL/EutN
MPEPQRPAASASSVSVHVIPRPHADVERILPKAGAAAKG